MAIFVIWQWIVTLDSIHNSCDVFCPTTIVTTIINLYGGGTSDKTFSSSQVVFSSTVVTTLFLGPEKHCIQYDWPEATFEGEIAVIPSIGFDMKCVNPSMTFGEVYHSFWCRPTMSQAEWALLAMLGKHQEVFDFVQEVLLTDGFSLTSIYNSDVRHPVDGYFCRCTYTSLMATFCTFTSNHPFQGPYL